MGRWAGPSDGAEWGVTHCCSWLQSHTPSLLLHCQAQVSKCLWCHHFGGLLAPDNAIEYPCWWWCFMTLMNWSNCDEIRMAMFRDSGVSQESLPFHLTLRGERSSVKSETHLTIKGTLTRFAITSQQCSANSGTLYPLCRKLRPTTTLGQGHIQTPSLSGTLGSCPVSPWIALCDQTSLRCDPQ